MLMGAFLASTIVAAAGEDENRTSATAPSEFEKWMKPFTEYWAGEMLFGHDLVPDLAISWQRLRKLDGSRTANSWSPDFGSAVSKDGKFSPFAGTFFHTGSMESKPAERFQQLAGRLPNSNMQLPPEDRRIVVQTSDYHRIRARVYDRGNLPDELLEMIRMTECRIVPWMPIVKFESRWKTHGDDMSVFGVAPDGNTIISAPSNGSLKFWEFKARMLIKKADVVQEGQEAHPTGLVFSPDGAIAIIESWRTCYAIDARIWKRIMTFEEPEVGNKFPLLGCPKFMPDGNHLLLVCSDGTLRIFDTKTWERVESLPGLPASMSDYVPAPKAQRGLALDGKGALELWDAARQRKVVRLDNGVQIQSAAFSPDESRVVIGTGNRDDTSGARIRIWNLENGNLEHELRAFEHDGSCESVTKLEWTADGRYVLGAIKQEGNSEYSGQSILVWSAVTGRHCGGFQGPADVAGFDVLPGGQQLVAGDKHGTIHVWNLAAALKSIDETGKSFATER